IDGEEAIDGDGFYNGESRVDISHHEGSIDVADFVLGADGENHRYGLNEAAVDELAVYDEALSADEVNTIIELQTIEVEPADKEPVLQVDFDDETVTDKSDNAIQAEVVGNPTFVDGLNGGKAIYFENPA